MSGLAGSYGEAPPIEIGAGGLRPVVRLRGRDAKTGFVGAGRRPARADFARALRREFIRQPTRPAQYDIYL